MKSFTPVYVMFLTLLLLAGGPMVASGVASRVVSGVASFAGGNQSEGSQSDGAQADKTVAEPTTTETTDFFGQSPYVKSSIPINAVGLRFGYSSGIWFRRLLPMNNSLDILLSGRNRGLQLTALYGTHRPFLASHLGDLFWYSGFGGHIGYNRYYRPGNFSVDTVFNWPSGQNYLIISDDRRSTSVSIGFDAMLGLSYQPTELPFTVGMEFKPFLDFFDRERFMRLHLDYGFMVAYTF